MLIHDYLKKAVVERPDNTAVTITSGEKLSYRELANLSDELAISLQQLGICSGDRVGIFMKKSIPAVVSIYASLMANAIYVPIDIKSPLEYNSHFIKECSLNLVLADEHATSLLLQSDQDTELVLADTLSLHGHTISVFKFKNNLKFCKPNQSDFTDQNIAVLLQTSGSTGKSKIISHSHQNCVELIEWYSHLLDANEFDHVGCHVPFNFAASIFDLFFPARFMATLVLIEEHISQIPAWLPQTINENKITILKCPSAVLSLSVQFSNSKHSMTSESLRYLIFGGGAFPVKYLEKFHSMFPTANIINTYAGSEALTIMAYKINDFKEQRVPIGKEHFSCKIKIVDDEGSDIIDMPGELWVSGPLVMNQYWNPTQRDERAFHIDSKGERWYKTGDMMIKKQSGEIYFYGRRDRMIKRRGYRIGLEEVEAYVLAHLKIAETAAVAPKDEVSGCKIIVFYKLKNDLTLSSLELREFLVQTMPPQMLPDALIELEDLPKTTTGKIDLINLERRQIPF